MKDTASQSQTPPPASASSGLREYATSIGVAILLALLIRSTVVQAFYIPSGSMEDTLFVGDYLLANKFVYGAPIEVPLVGEPLFRLPSLRDPRPGDIVIFRSKTEPNRDLIKRCVAVGGQTVEVRNKVLYVDGEPFPDPPESKYTDPMVYGHAGSSRDNFGPRRVPEDHFFMMGDNRDNSNDSRVFGPVPRRLVKGKAMIIYWSSHLVAGPLYSGPQLLMDLGNFVWNLPTLPIRTRYGRLGDVIH
ncbi:signal peptidase I [Candidatus Latescibacterota bacterium]